MKSKDSSHYLLKTDTQIWKSLKHELAKMNIYSIDELEAYLRKENISTLAQLWTFTSSSKCTDQLAVDVELLFKRIKSVSKNQIEPFMSSAQVGYYFMDKLAGQAQEQLYGVFLDTKHRIIAEKLIFQGTLNKAIVHPRDVFRWGLLYNCAAFLIVHNHPSGDKTPSQQDLKITKKLKKASEYMGINFLDHFIVSDDSYLSFREQQLL